MGAINWFKPGRSSFKLAGIQVRGQKAVYLQAVYGVVAMIGALLQGIISIVAGIVSFATSGIRRITARRQAAVAERERPHFVLDDLA